MVRECVSALTRVLKSVEVPEVSFVVTGKWACVGAAKSG